MILSIVLFITAMFIITLTLINNPRRKKVCDTIPPYLLPIGSIVILHGINHKVAVFGIHQINLENGIIYDYIGVPYPSGFINNGIYMFNHKDIIEVVHIGYNDIDWEDYIQAPM